MHLKLCIHRSLHLECFLTHLSTWANADSSFRLSSSVHSLVTIHHSFLMFLQHLADPLWQGLTLVLVGFISILVSPTTGTMGTEELMLNIILPSLHM